MKKPWETFEKNYVAVEHPDPETGKIRMRYEYCGPWFVCPDEAGLTRAKRICGAGLAGSLAAALWAGTGISELNQAALTCVPYGLSLAALIFAAVGVGRLLFFGRKVKRPDYEQTDRLMTLAPAAAGGLLLFAFLAGIGLILAGRAAWKDALPLAGWLAGGGCALLIHFAYRGLRFRKEKNTEFEYDPETIPASRREDA